MMDEASSMTGGEWPIQINEEASTKAAQNWVTEATKKIQNIESESFHGVGAVGEGVNL